MTKNTKVEPELSSAEDLANSLRRTVVPIVVGFLLAQATRWGFDIPADQLTGVIESLFAGLYYAVVRVLEVNYPQLGALLGASKQPRY